MNTVVVGVGSNISAEANIGRAKALIAEEQRLVKASTFKTTSPIGFVDQPDFLNGAFLIETEMEEHGFRGYLKDLEYRLGRVRTGDTYGPRTIDLDIIVWNGRIVNDDFYGRGFVRDAVAELLPERTGGA